MLVKTKLNSIILLLIFFQINAFSQNSLNKKEPANEIASTKDNEIGVTFNSKMNEVYFTRSVGKWGKEKQRSSIYYSKKNKGVWSKPKLVSFSGKYNDGDPHLTSDNKNLYFISDRPNDSKKISDDIWVVEKNEKGVWGIPKNLGEKINSDKMEFSPRTTSNGDLYFASDREGGYGQGDIYFAKNENGKFSRVVNLGNRINSPTGEWNLEINKKGTVIIFEASGRKTNFSSYGDLYISFKKKGKWTVPQNIKEINTTGSDLLPYLSKNNKYLYFSSTNYKESLTANLYKIRFRKLLKKYKQNSKN